MIERALVEEAAAAGYVAANDAVNTAEGTFPLGFIRAEEGKCRGADGSGIMEKRAIISDEAIAGGEVVDKSVTFEVELEGGVTESFRKSGRRTSAAGGGEDGNFAVFENLGREFDVAFEGPFGGRSKVGSGDDGNVEIFARWRAGRRGEVRGLKRIRAKLFNEKKVVIDLMFYGADFPFNLDWVGQGFG